MSQDLLNKVENYQLNYILLNELWPMAAYCPEIIWIFLFRKRSRQNKSNQRIDWHRSANTNTRKWKNFWLWCGKCTKTKNKEWEIKNRNYKNYMFQYYNHRHLAVNHANLIKWKWDCDITYWHQDSFWNEKHNFPTKIKNR